MYILSIDSLYFILRCNINSIFKRNGSLKTLLIIIVINCKRTQSIHTVNLLLKNFKKNRPVRIDYKQDIYARSAKLITPNDAFIQDGSTIKCATTLEADNQKLFSYKLEVVN
jgi:hypothetical protein